MTTAAHPLTDRAGDEVAARSAGRLAGLRRHRRVLLAAVVVVLLGQMAAAMVTAAAQQTPTIDEPVYVGAAAVYAQQHSLRYNPEHPPLGKLIIGLGVGAAQPRLDPGFTGGQTALGRHLLYETGNDPWRLMFLARLPIILLTLLFGLVVFAFARDLAGPAGAVVALALYAFSPDVIAHGSLATLDVPAAGFVLTAVWLLWRARRSPWRYLPLAALAFGAALATKMSTLVAAAALLPLAAASVWYAGRAAPRTGTPAKEAGEVRSEERSDEDGPRRPSGAPARAERGPSNTAPEAGEVRSEERSDEDGSRRPSGAPARAERGPSNTAPRHARLLLLGLAAAVGMAVVGVAVVWLSYLAVDPRLRWATPPDLPSVAGMRGLVVDWLPFPRPYRDGMRVQFEFEDFAWRGYLFGETYSGGRWYYLPAALLVKTPLGALALWIGGAVALVVVRRLRPAAPYLLAPTAVLLLAAMAGSRNFGTRYAVFVPLFLAVAVAGVAMIAWRRRWATAVTAALVAFVAFSSLRAFPYHLPYANEAFGGPAATHRHLHDSNVDWGQDLGRLADRLRERYPGERVWLVYKGAGVPSWYGIDASDPLAAPPDQVRGLLVVSNSTLVRAGGRLKSLVDSSTKVDDVGHSITIFRR